MSLLVLSSEFLLSNFCVTLADEVRIARLGGERGYNNSSCKHTSILRSGSLCWPILLNCTYYPVMTLKFKKLFL